MEGEKYVAWILLGVAILWGILGLFWLIILFTLLAFILGALVIVYLQHGDLDKYLDRGLLENPLDDPPKSLGLNLVTEKKPIVIITPNIKIQTESKKLKHLFATDNKKKSIFDSGLDLLFKKHTKSGIKESGYASSSSSSPSSSKHHHHHTSSKKHNTITDHLFHRGSNPFRSDTILDSIDQQHHSSAASSTSNGNTSPNHHHRHHDHGHERKSWKPFENIKIYTDKKKSSNSGGSGGGGSEPCKISGDISLGEEVNGSDDSSSTTSATSASQPKKTILSGNKQLDLLLHRIIDYAIRDFIDVWFVQVTDNREFSESRVRECIEEFVINLCNRTKTAQWMAILTEKMVEDLATHTKLYRIAHQVLAQEVADRQKLLEKQLSPQRKSKKSQHKRNKSDTDLNWFLNNQSATKNVTNSRFYEKPSDKPADPEFKLLEAFFNNSELYKNECLDPVALEKYLTHISETILYFSLRAEEFSCLPLRTLLSTLLANAVFKPLLEMLSDPDFINLQIARLCAKEAPSIEFFVKLVRQCSDLSELRACRQLLTQEMNLKYDNPINHAYINELKAIQDMIDRRIHVVQGTPISEVDTNRYREKQTRHSIHMIILTLDEILNHELAKSYYLDYLSSKNLQRYVLFYMVAQKWQEFVKSGALAKDKAREEAATIYAEYLDPVQPNHLLVDTGLVDTLQIKLRTGNIAPDSIWFDSISKFIYEKLKNEDVCLNGFYQSPLYKKLLRELDFEQPGSNDSDTELNMDIGSDSNSNDFVMEDDDECSSSAEGAVAGNIGSTLKSVNHLDVFSPKHTRSHSDCTEIVRKMQESPVPVLKRQTAPANSDLDQYDTVDAKQKKFMSLPKEYTGIELKPRLTAAIINVGIRNEGQYAVYSIEVVNRENNVEKRWHVYRRYSRFLDLKKVLGKKFPELTRLPFPSKKVFQNTQRALLEQRMNILNYFLLELCKRTEKNQEIYITVRDFLEPDNEDRIQSGAVIRTLETIVVNPLKSGIRTIKNMPDNFVSGLSRIFLGRSLMKESSAFLQVPSSIPLEQKSSEYPALTSALKLLDEVFDLQSRSQWLRRGIINRLLGAPWVSHTANKKILQTAKSLIEHDKIELILDAILTNVWPDGKQQRRPAPREDNTKLRTRMAAKVALFALVTDDLKHVVGSETTRSGLLNFFEMWQHEKLNLRLVLILLNHILTVLYRMDSMTKHVDATMTTAGPATSKK